MSPPSSPPLGPIPSAVRRLLPPGDHTLPAAGEPWELIRRVLEDGDGEDLRWLVSALGEETLRRFLRQRGGRQLSRRSRQFWSLLLGVESSAPHPLTAELWPF